MSPTSSHKEKQTLFVLIPSGSSTEHVLHMPGCCHPLGHRQLLTYPVIYPHQKEEPFLSFALVLVVPEAYLEKRISFQIVYFKSDPRIIGKEVEW